MADPAPSTGDRLSPGDRLPFAYGMDAAQRYWSFEDQAGAASLLLVAGDAPPSAIAAMIAALDDRRAEITALGAVVRVLAPAGGAGWATAATPVGMALSHVMDRTLAASLGGGPCLALADRAMRLAARIDFAGREAAAVADALASLQALEPPDPPAPVLVVPRVLAPELCRRLIAAFEAGGHVDGAMASIDAEGRAISRIDAAKKHRRDLELDAANPLHAEVVAALCSRLLPEMAKAFHARPAHLDRILVARYDDSGGFFRRHRDNSSAHLAYREFALSLNLNTGEYDGGELLFPEFSDRRHAPPLGGALVFSASLLHEALPVTRGRRYVLLSFLHGEAAEARRLAFLAEAATPVTEPA